MGSGTGRGSGLPSCAGVFFKRKQKNLILRRCMQKQTVSRAVEDDPRNVAACEGGGLLEKGQNKPFRLLDRDRAGALVQALCIFPALEIPGGPAVVCGVAEGKGRAAIAADEKTGKPVCIGRRCFFAGAPVWLAKPLLVVLKQGGKGRVDFMGAVKAVSVPDDGSDVKGVLENAAHGAAVKGTIPFGADLSFV